jgi:hypothetical protein
MSTTASLTDDSACPLQAGTPIEANGVIWVNQNDVAAIPSIALSIPDFEGEAILRIFSNSTQSEIGCFSAVVTNGATFSQPMAVGPVLGVFTLVAVIASFAAAAYGDNIPEMRKHYAHSMSVSVVFAVWHHIYFSGALSLNWPSVLVAFWSNYAWAGGMIYTESMQNTINSFIGSNKGNTSIVGAAGTGVQNSDIGGGFDIHQIYKRNVFPQALNVPGLIRRNKYNRATRQLETALAKRELADQADGYSWYGNPVKPGLPLPGNYSGFAGTLAQKNIPASNAFMTGLLWFLILVGAVVFAVLAFKLLLEGLSATKLMKGGRFSFFRTHYIGYTTSAVLRTLFIGFFMVIFLCLFQFTYLASPAPVAVACVIFLIMLLGLGGLAGYACFYRVKFGTYVSEPDRLNVEKRTVLKIIPWCGFSRASTNQISQDRTYTGSVPWWRIRSSAQEKSIHDDDEYTKKFGWLASRFRRTKWWFFVVWLVYEFIRACFLAGASGHPKVQVFGLLAVEVVAFVGLFTLRPFEGQRLNLIVVYVLGFSKVATVALSVAFDTSLNVARIPSTIVGVVIIVIQGILTIVVMIAIIVGAISTYFSLTRQRNHIRPKKWNPIREKYFKHMDRKVSDAPPPPPPPPEVPKGPYFSVKSIKRMAKIEDEDPEFVAEIGGKIGGNAEIPSGRSRAASLQSQMSHSSLPYGARVHRASWSSRDLTEQPGQYTTERRRTRGNSLRTFPEIPSRPSSRAVSELNARMVGSSEDIRISSPDSSRSPFPGATLPLQPAVQKAEVSGI